MSISEFITEHKTKIIYGVVGLGVIYIAYSYLSSGSSESTGDLSVSMPTPSAEDYQFSLASQQAANELAGSMQMAQLDYNLQVATLNSQLAIAQAEIDSTNQANVLNAGLQSEALGYQNTVDLQKLANEQYATKAGYESTNYLASLDAANEASSIAAGLQLGLAEIDSVNRGIDASKAISLDNNATNLAITERMAETVEYQTFVGNLNKQLDIAAIWQQGQTDKYLADVNLQAIQDSNRTDLAISERQALMAENISQQETNRILNTNATNLEGLLNTNATDLSKTIDTNATDLSKTINTNSANVQMNKQDNDAIKYVSKQQRKLGLGIAGGGKSGGLMGLF